MTWKTDQIQAVVFPLPGAKQSSALELWHKLFPATEPESFQGSGSSPMAGSQASGTSGDFQIAVSSQIGRVDITLSTGATVDASMMPPQIENLERALDHLDGIVLGLLKIMRVARVATVAQLSVHLGNPEEIVDFFAKAVGIDFPKGSADNLYQFNVRSSYSSNASIPMNRVVTWAAGAKQLVDAQFDLSNTQFGVSTRIVIPVAALKIDINSASSQDITASAGNMFLEHSIEIQKIVRDGMEMFRGH